MSKSLILYSFIALFFASCAHKFDHSKVASYSGTIKQVLKVKIKQNNNTERLTIYSTVNRTKKQAMLDGVGRFDKHIFTLNVKNGTYTFKDHINKESSEGRINDFEIIPLDEEILFTKIDKNNAQPIIVENNKRNIMVEITVLEQE